MNTAVNRFMCLGLVLFVASCGEKLGIPGPDHPIVGKWSLVSTPTCTEFETVHADGTRDFTSGEEIGQASFVISSKPNSRGVYTVVDTIVKDNGKPDCKGSVTPVGDVVTLYIRFNRAGNRSQICFDARMTRCLAVSKRLSSTN